MSMKAHAKGILRLICRVLVWPAVMCCRVQSRLGNPQAAFAGWSQLFSLLPGRPGVYLRHAFFQRTMQHCGTDACISFGTIFSHPAVAIGHTAYIGHFCSIGAVRIEDDVLIASHVSIMNGCQQHGTSRLDVPVREQPGSWLPITIGRDTWIGERATVAASIGRQCLIGAGAVVLDPLPDYAIAVGVPARIIGDRRQRTAASPTPAAAADNSRRTAGHLTELSCLAES